MPMNPQSDLVVGICAIVSKRYKWEQKSDATLEKNTGFLLSDLKRCQNFVQRVTGGVKDKKVNKFSGDSGTEVCVPSQSGFQSSKSFGRGGRNVDTGRRAGCYFPLPWLVYRRPSPSVGPPCPPRALCLNMDGPLFLKHRHPRPSTSPSSFLTHLPRHLHSLPSETLSGIKVRARRSGIKIIIQHLNGRI